MQVSYIAPRATKTKINSAAVVAMNQQLGNAMDDPRWVAKIIVRSLSKPMGKDIFIGWPEKLFIRINALVPSLVDATLRRQLATIHKYSLL